ncbi:endonuclease V [Rubinisphaera italica]|uniref:Endonuclease V n=1 Tax=Rubinisphaera italica TaxID=2527969 RepID=A0A5C5XK93_9PLAN|nr:endonuclease V [Rubinisphaera italica]TWT63118.1 Endonuclease V [Rubinisphaera italica]
MSQPEQFLSHNLQISDLRAEVISLLQQIPAGSISTFGSLARALGDIKAAKWIGTLLKHDPGRKLWPWHRIVMQNLQLPLTSGVTSSSQKVLLRAEGVTIQSCRIDPTTPVFDEFRSNEPLHKLQLEQRDISERILLTSGFKTPKSVAGIDIGYPKPGIARAAYVEWNLVNRCFDYELAIETPINFPYITGYLTYRELPAYLELFKAVKAERNLAEILLVDGSGVLHPRKCGIACHLGVLLNHPTVGVSKKILTGKVDLTNQESNEIPILDAQNKATGIAMRKTLENKFVYASPGHRVGLQEIPDLLKLCWSNHRLPEPIYLADKLSKHS